jgi:penicillin-binding protein 1A
VFLKDGKKLCEYSYEKRYFIPIDKIPKKLINAFVAVEDKHFYEHNGVDFIGIFRSILKNVENIGSGKRPHGASTITQQIARIFLIKNNEISYVRKIKEAMLAFRIESSLPKNKILELYLNQIYMGLGVYGVAAAAKAYFDKTVDELTIGECSYLASLAKGANNYHPVNNKKNAIARRNWAINRQLEDRYITEKEAEAACKEDIALIFSQEEVVNADYFSEEVRKFLIEKFPIDSLNKEGLLIRGTLDLRLQKCACNAIKKGLEEVDRRFGWRGAITSIDVRNCDTKDIIGRINDIPTPKGGESFQKAVVASIQNSRIGIITEIGDAGEIVGADVKWIGNKIKIGDVIFISKISEKIGKENFSVKQIPLVQGAIIVIEVDSGRILAMHGGYSFSQSEFNRVTQAMRQSGSAFKPFVYLAGLENGFSPNTTIDSSSVEIDLGDSLGVWKPKNYKNVSIDKITFRRALERSVNTATVRIAQEIGMAKIAKIAELFGIFDEMPHYLSYALGAGDTTLLKLTTAYAMIANGGKHITPTMIDYVQDKRGNVLYRNDSRIIDNNLGFDSELPPKLNDNRKQIIDERSVYQMTSLLEGVVQRGSGYLARDPNFSIAGKTGTSNESRDTWFIGYTPDIAVGIFVGFDEQSKNLGKNANGTNTPLPIFVDFMQEAKKFLVPKPFKVPKGIKLRKIDLESGADSLVADQNTIIEAFKDDDSSENYIMETKKRKNILELMDDNDGHNAGFTEEESDADVQKIKPISGIY